MKANVFEESATAVARRFGVSAKALRVYERLGLLEPPRTEAGWRVYRHAERERLSVIIALTQLGLPLRRNGPAGRDAEEGIRASRQSVRGAAKTRRDADGRQRIRQGGRRNLTAPRTELLWRD